ncbi:MAG: glucosidase family protein [Armatimonadota bacterium]
MTVDRSDAVFVPPIVATEEWWGAINTDRTTYKPLEEVRVRLRKPARGADAYRMAWYDGLGNGYGFASGEFDSAEAEVSFLAGGEPGMQHILIWFDPSDEHSAYDRLVSFTLAAETEISCANQDISDMYTLSKESVLLNRRRYRLPEGEVIGYTTADSGNSMDFWLRDMFYSLTGHSLWEQDITSGFEALWSRQMPDGSFPDWVDACGHSERMPSESDVEYIAALALYQVWLIKGDDDWLRKHLPAIERGIKYATSHPMRWDVEHSFIRRAHTCDTWDFDIDTDAFTDESNAVAATCDQSGLYSAWLALAHIYEHLGDSVKAIDYRASAESLRERCNRLLWDGEKYQHHLHLTGYAHEEFNEADQLAMGNTWAMTRGLAERKQCTAIVDTYMRRWDLLECRFPWWSLDPGYPVWMGRVLHKKQDYLQPGGYANGGMMPWVGGALALGAFRNGREDVAARLLLDYARFLKESGGRVYTWYWPNMQPGFRTTTRNTTGHDGWGMGHWLGSLVEGLVGLRITEPGISSVELSPRWQSMQSASARVVLHYPSADKYVAYTYYESERCIRIVLTGSAKRILLRTMLPADASIESAHVNKTRVAAEIDQVEGATYAVLHFADAPIWDVQIYLKDKSNDPSQIS